jgi:hypothetical protein
MIRGREIIWGKGWEIPSRRTGKELSSKEIIHDLNNPHFEEKKMYLNTGS